MQSYDVLDSYITRYCRHAKPHESHAFSVQLTRTFPPADYYFMHSSSDLTFHI